MIPRQPSPSLRLAGNIFNICDNLLDAPISTQLGSSRAPANDLGSSWYTPIRSSVVDGDDGPGTGYIK